MSDISTGSELPKPEPKEVQPREPYTLFFGDLITFGKKEDPEAVRSVIVDVGNGGTYKVAHLIREGDLYLLSPLAFSTHGVELDFERYDQVWSLEQIREAMENFYNKALRSSNEKERDMYLKFKNKNLNNLEKWSQRKSRDVTEEVIQEEIKFQSGQSSDS